MYVWLERVGTKTIIIQYINTHPQRHREHNNMADCMHADKRTLHITGLEQSPMKAFGITPRLIGVGPATFGRESIPRRYKAAWSNTPAQRVKLKVHNGTDGRHERQQKKRRWSVRRTKHAPRRGKNVEVKLFYPSVSVTVLIACVNVGFGWLVGCFCPHLN
jgi:hypothetical protein